MTTLHSIPVITFDGPSGTGKGTISQMLARKLDWHYLDSGSTFRVLAYVAAQAKINLDDEEGLTQFAQTLPALYLAEEEGTRIIFQGRDITAKLRAEEVAKMASQVAALPKVRATLANVQRDFRRPPGLVTDGRDMGTVIFPDAVVKFFLDASPEERAQRRYLQLKTQELNVSLPEILKDIEQRDSRDRSRDVAPLKPAADAIRIDTTSLTIDEVLSEVLKHVEAISFAK